MRNNAIIIVILCSVFFFSIPAKSQSFEPRESTHRTKGLAEFGNQILAYGTGLVWMDTEGKVLDKRRIVEGAPSSDFIHGVSDTKGGSWLLSQKGLIHMDMNKTARTIFTFEEIAQGDLKEIKAMPDGSIYCLARNAVIKVAHDHSYKYIYTNSSSKGHYFNHFDVSSDGQIYIASYKEIFKINADGQISNYTLKRKPNFQDLHCTEDGKVIILEYKGIYELKDEAVVPFIKGNEISRGLKLYKAVFTRSDDFWLYSNAGNVLRNKGGTWHNFIPPADLKTGNFGEFMMLSSTGDLWMSLAGYAILKYDGKSWKRINLDKKTAIPNISTASLQNDRSLLTFDAKAKTLYRAEEGALQAWKKIKTDKARNFQLDEKDALYWSNPQGIYTLTNGEEKKMISADKINSFYKLKDSYLYAADKKIYLSKNGRSEVLENNIHFLGWDKISGAKFYRAFDNKVLATSSSRRGLISIYDGTKWSKLVQIDGKKLKKLVHVFTYKESTHLVMEDHQIIRYDATGWHWVDRPQVVKDIKYPKAQMSSDGSIWLFDINENITLLKDGELSKIEMPLKEKGINPRLITKVDDKTYDIFMDGVVLRCTL